MVWKFLQMGHIYYGLHFFEWQQKKWVLYLPRKPLEHRIYLHVVCMDQLIVCGNHIKRREYRDLGTPFNLSTGVLVSSIH